jgi:hypothetical protein
LTPFSVGAGAGAPDGDVVVVVVVVLVDDDGACCPLVPHAARVPIAISDDPTAIAVRRRLLWSILTVPASISSGGRGSSGGERRAVLWALAAQ